MKNLMYLFLASMMIAFGCSCDNIGGQHVVSEKPEVEEQMESQTEQQVNQTVDLEKYFSYQVVTSTHPSSRYVHLQRPSWHDDLGKCWELDEGNFVTDLIICYGNEESSQYLMFDDEEDYDDYIFEWSLALKIAIKLYDANLRYCKEDRNDSCYFVLDSREDTLITFYYRNGYAIDNKGDTIDCGETIQFYENKYFDNPQKSIGELLNYTHCLPNCINSYKYPEVVEIFKKTYYDLQEALIFMPEKGYGYRYYPIEEEKYGWDYLKLYRVKDGQFENVPGGALGIQFMDAETKELKTSLESLKELLGVE